MLCPEHDPHCPAGLSLDDAPQPYDALQADVPLTSRFPDWRVLHQTVGWMTSAGKMVPLNETHTGDVEALLTAIRSDALDWHAQASCDEFYATSSGMRWAYQQLGILMIGETHPQIWLNSTPLIREMQRRVDEANAL